MLSQSQILFQIGQLQIGQLENQLKANPTLPIAQSCLPPNLNSFPILSNMKFISPLSPSSPQLSINLSTLKHIINISQNKALGNIIFRIHQVDAIINRNRIQTIQERGIQLRKVQTWRFQNKEDTQITYCQRQYIFQQVILIIKILQAYKHKTNLCLPNLQQQDILIQRLQTLTQNKYQHHLSLKIQWIHKLINQNQPKLDDSIYLQTIKLILMKIIGIQKVQSNSQILKIKSIQDVIKLKYNHFYQNVNKRVQTQQESIQTKLITNRGKFQQSANKFIHEMNKIHKLNTKTVQGGKSIIFNSNEQKQRFWKQIQKAIVNNLNESQKQAQIKGLIQKAKKGIQKVAIKEKPIGKPTQQSSQAIPQKFMQLQIHHQLLCLASGINFNPSKLLPLIQNKSHLLYIIKEKSIKQKNNVIAFYSNVKVNDNFNTIFGRYFQDINAKSFIYSPNNSKIYRLKHKQYAVGYGPEVFLTIGKLDIVIPAFAHLQHVKCVSYFPISYENIGRDIDQEHVDKIQNYPNQQQYQTQKSQKQVNLVSLQNHQFQIQDIQIYQINFKLKYTV